MFWVLKGAMADSHAACDRQDITRARITQNVGVVAIIDTSAVLLAISDNHAHRGWVKRTVELKDIGCITIKDVFHSDVVEVIEKCINYSEENPPPTSQTHVCDIFFAFRTYVTMLSQLDGRLVLEIEDFERTRVDAKSIVATSNIIGKLDANSFAVDTVNDLCRELFQATSYDRAMTYVFLDDLSGEVVFELVRDDTIKSSFLGLRFPPGDIPLPARKAYLQNPVRFIADVDDDPCYLIQKDLDLSLSRSFLRGCVKPHRSYLRNMGVRSSLSIAITNLDGGLWGLVALHSYTMPIVPKVEDRVSFSILSTVTSKHVQSIERDERLDVQTRLKKLVGEIDAKKSLGFFIIENKQELLQLFNVDSITLFSPCEDPIAIGKYGARLEDIPIDRDVLACGTLQDPVRSFACLTILGYTIILTRKSSYEPIRWAGNPRSVEKPETSELPSDLAMPRRSFEMYLDHQSEYPPPFTKQDKIVFFQMGDMLTSVIQQIRIEYAERKAMRAKRESDLAGVQSDENYAFFANMSHELRAPLHAITGVFDIISNLKSDDERVDQYSAIGLSTCRDMMKTLNNILSVVKNTHEDNQHQLRLVMVREIFHSTTEGLRIFAKNNKVRLDTDFECDPTVIVRIDTDKACHIYNNIVSNAIKFASSKPSSVVDVRTYLIPSREGVSEMWYDLCAKNAGSYSPTREEKFCDNAGSVCKWLVVTTTDYGCGIYQKDMEKIFNMFTQVEDVVTKKFSSTGLGLHICLQNTISLHGFLGVASTPGQKTTFLFAIPVESSFDKSDRQHVKRVDSEMLESNDLFQDQTLVFVVVDDSKVNLMIAKKQIERGFPKAIIYTASDGKSGLDKIMSLHREGIAIDGILMDYHMPIMSGLEATRLIRKECRLPITMLTADITDESRQSMLASGCDFIMLKPSTPDQLMAKCREMVQLSKS